eukprot:2386520-Lingulodinium_polyedra.AAC.1
MTSQTARRRARLCRRRAPNPASGRRRWPRRGRGTRRAPGAPTTCGAGPHRRRKGPRPATPPRRGTTAPPPNNARSRRRWRIAPTSAFPTAPP